MRIVFAGTPEFARVALAALLDAGHQLVGVYTQPDRPAGRGMKLQPSPVKQLALEHGLPVWQPLTLKDDTAVSDLQALSAEVMVVAAYGLILPQRVLDVPTLGCINIHASLLPRWRGAAPIHRAVLAGDTETGVTIMRMDAGLDTGPMLARRATPLAEHETTGQVHDRLASLGGALLLEVLADLPRCLAQAEPQPEQGVSYAGKIGKTEAQLDWQQSAVQLARQVRAFNPAPGASTELAGERLKIWDARPVELAGMAAPGRPGEVLEVGRDRLLVATGDGGLELLEVQRAGARRAAVKDFLAGHALTVGMMLGA